LSRSRRKLTTYPDQPIATWWRDARRHLGVAQASKAASQPAEYERDANRSSGVFSGGMSSQDEDAGTDHGADPKGDKIDGREGAFERFCGQGRPAPRSPLSGTTVKRSTAWPKDHPFRPPRVAEYLAATPASDHNENHMNAPRAYPRRQNQICRCCRPTELPRLPRDFRSWRERVPSRFTLAS
jgi:hypothetical protein